MNLFRLFKQSRSAPVARQRLLILLEYERSAVIQTDLIAVLREEISAVVGRYFDADPNTVKVKEVRGATGLTVAINVMIPNRAYATAIARHPSGEGISSPVYQ